MIRSSITHFHFAHPFTLAGHTDTFPAGSYEVLAEDELLEGLSFEAFRRVSTALRIEGHGAQAGLTELRSTTPQDLEAAQARDHLTSAGNGAR